MVPVGKINLQRQEKEESPSAFCLIMAYSSFFLKNT